MGVFYIIFCAIAFAMQLAAWAWLIKCFPALGFRGPLLISVVTTLLMLAGFTLTRTHQTGLFWHALYYVAYIYFGLVFLAFCFCAGFAVLGKILTWFHVPTGWLGVATLITLAVVFILAFWGGFSTPKTKYVRVNIPGAPKLKLAVLSDTHLGMGVSVGRFAHVIERIKAESPDGLLVLGDIFEYGPYRAQYAALLKQLHTPLGSYGVLGNHEYYVGYGDSKDFFKEAGITLLENTAVILPNGVQIAGLKDIKTAGVTAQDVAAVLSPLAKDEPTILLSHTPLLEDIAARHGVNLMLSGHTHNGQLWPFTYLVRMVFPHSYGLYYIDDMRLYVTSGVFYWGIPLRLFAPAELVFVEVNA